MNKKKIILISVAVFLIVIIIFTNIGGHKVTLRWEPVEGKSKTFDSVELNVYIENSGSMDGYMCAGSNLKDAVFDYVSDLEKESKKTSLFYINSQVIPCSGTLENYIQNLNPASFATTGGDRANTDLRHIFEMMLQRHKAKSITIFVSDCILDVQQNASAFFGNCQVSIKNSFTRALKQNPDLGVQIIKLQSKFNGYWYCGVNKELLTNVKRPYYIWVIGDKYLLAQINKNIPYNEIIGGVSDYCAYSSSEGKIPFAIDKDKYVVNSHTNKISVEIAADMSKSLQSNVVLTNLHNYSAKEPAQVSVVSSQRIMATNSKYSHLITVEIEKPQSLNSASISFNYPELPSWVIDTNEDTGKHIKQNLGKTTGLRYLVQGVAEAYKSSAPYGEISFEIKK